MFKTPTFHLFTAGLVLLFSSELAKGDALEKLKADKLAAVAKARIEYQKQRKNLKRSGPFQDFRANLHVHSHFSHDSIGQIDNIVAAAKRAGTSILMFSEHPADHYDFFKDGHRGTKDGVLLIPGAEAKGFLVYPTHSVKGLDAGTSQEYADMVRRRRGMTFLSHVEGKMDWNITGMTGTEIYNTHADVMDERKLTVAMRNPFWIFGIVGLFEKYPQECFSALLNYPEGYLKKWDEMCLVAPHTGVAANDAHENVGLVIKLAEKGKARLEDPIGEKLMELDVSKVDLFKPMIAGKKPGDEVFRLQMDPYEYSLRHAGTHLLLREQTEEEVWEALEKGRAYVAFDWIADATGFDFAAMNGNDRHEMGSLISYSKEMKLTAQAPLPAKWKLVRNGKVISEAQGETFEFKITEPGNYRTEAWLPLGGEDTIWILSNPIYVK